MAATCGLRCKGITNPMRITAKQYEDYHYICDLYILTGPNEVLGLYCNKCHINSQYEQIQSEIDKDGLIKAE
jgi:hypothetical protein